MIPATCAQVFPELANDLANCPPEFLSLVQAVKDSKVHIVATPGGFHVHFGDIKKININCADFSLGNVSIANCGLINCSNNVASVKGILIPVDSKKMGQAVEYMQSCGIMDSKKKP